MRMCVGIIGFSLVSAPAGAQAVSALSDESAPSIVVTAVRVPIASDRVASSVTILDKEKIDRLQAPVVSDLLVLTPGISVVRNGGYGAATSVRIRGADPDHTVLVIDGVRLADPSAAGGGYNFANLLTGDIARIEILRGPQSILWGSQAIGGVVNISTSVPDRPREASFDVESGSLRTVNARATIGGAGESITWRLAATRFYTDGISAISPRFGGQEADAHSNSAGNARVGIRLSPAVTLDLRGYYSRSHTDIDSTGPVPDSPEQLRSEEWIAYAGIDFQAFSGALRNRVSTSQTETTRFGLNPARTIRPVTLDARGRSRRFEYQGSLDLSGGVVGVFGAEREEQNIRSASPPNTSASYPTARGAASTDSFFASVNARMSGGMTLTAGARHSRHSRFGGNTVFGAGAAWALAGGGTILRASYGEGFKAPTLFQLYSDFGNEALRPESARGWEAGVEQRLLRRRLNLSAGWFARDSKDLITFNGCPTSSQPPLCFAQGTSAPRSGYYANVRRARARGLELTASLRLRRLHADANYSWIASEDRSPGLSFGDQLPRQPRHLGSAIISYALEGGIEAGASIRWSGEARDTVRTSAAVAPFVNEAYHVVDLRVEAPVANGIRLFARVENLFDQYYETARRFGSLGRSVHAGLRARFQ